jgi:hypothetical protein
VKAVTVPNMQVIEIASEVTKEKLFGWVISSVNQNLYSEVRLRRCERARSRQIGSVAASLTAFGES